MVVCVFAASFFFRYKFIHWILPLYGSLVHISISFYLFANSTFLRAFRTATKDHFINLSDWIKFSWHFSFVIILCLFVFFLLLFLYRLNFSSALYVLPSLWNFKQKKNEYSFVPFIICAEKEIIKDPNWIGLLKLFAKHWRRYQMRSVHGWRTVWLEVRWICMNFHSPFV